MNPPHPSSSSSLSLKVTGMVPQSLWGLVVVALLVLSGCMPADRWWVREELALVQIQMAEVRDRVAVVEQQFGRIDPKVDRILVQIEQLTSRQTTSATPVGSAEYPPERRFVVDEGTFAMGTASLTPATRQAIDAFIHQVPGIQERQVVVVGHTDSTGSQEANYRVGQRRAAAVAQHLLGAHGLEPVRIWATSAGDSQPIADNATEEGRQRNRRVEILVYRDPAKLASEIRHQQLPRKLAEDQREQLLQTLREDPKVPLSVVSVFGDGESYAFAEELDMLFNIAGWPTRGVSQHTVAGLPPGLTFVTSSGDGPMHTRAVRLQDTLHAMGIAAHSRALESVPQGSLMLLVGPKPQ